MAETWLFADPHFGHRLMAQLRGFGEDIAAHDQAIITTLITHVRADDHLWGLGDLAMSRWADALELMAAVPGHKQWVAGNHDVVHPMHRGAHKYQRRWLEVFESVHTAARLQWQGRPVLLSHFPYSADREQYEAARFPQWRLPDHGGLLLHGHTHSPERLTGDHEVHVGLDAWGLRPVRLPDALAQLTAPAVPA